MSPQAHGFSNRKRGLRHGEMKVDEMRDGTNHIRRRRELSLVDPLCQPPSETLFTSLSRYSALTVKLHGCLVNFNATSAVATNLFKLGSRGEFNDPVSGRRGFLPKNTQHAAFTVISLAHQSYTPLDLMRTDLSNTPHGGNP